MTKEELFVEAVKSCEFEEVLRRYSAFTAREEAVNVALGRDGENYQHKACLLAPAPDEYPTSGDLDVTDLLNRYYSPVGRRRAK
jgi:hypothetical protein